VSGLIERERDAREDMTRSLTRFFSRLQKAGRIITTREPRVLALALYAYMLGLHTDYLRSPERYHMPCDAQTLARYFFAPLKPANA
jgi:TetR/AcrR family acrAB operon transcriptional repressor/TetR/AcrR family transcriptional repressor of mexAB-oprM operon